jgi:hypothetical protein
MRCESSVLADRLNAVGRVLAAKAAGGKAFRAAEGFTFGTNPGALHLVGKAAWADYTAADSLLVVLSVFSERQATRGSRKSKNPRLILSTAATFPSVGYRGVSS